MVFLVELLRKVEITFPRTGTSTGTGHFVCAVCGNNKVRYAKEDPRFSKTLGVEWILVNIDHLLSPLNNIPLRIFFEATRNSAKWLFLGLLS